MTNEHRRCYCGCRCCSGCGCCCYYQKAQRLIRNHGCRVRHGSAPFSNDSNPQRKVARAAMQTITIVLTKYSDILSNFIYLMSGGGYTHVSLSLGDEKDVMYSFNYKGFCIETLEKHRRRGVTKSMCYQMQVSEKAYDKLKKHVQYFVEHREEFRYTRLGAILCFLRIPFRWKDHYFCSQFVAEILTRTGAVKLKMSPSLYLPNHLKNELAYSWQLQHVQYNPV